MIRKHYMMEEKDLEIIEEVRKNKGLANSAEALRYIIRKYAENEKKETSVNLAILRSIEEKVTILLDAANTDLIKRNDEVCYPVSMVESPVVRRSREVHKKAVSNKKQRKDYKNGKG